MKRIEIGDKTVGDGHPTFVIAEAGANYHISKDPKINFKHALKLVDIAADAGADSVKFQLYRANKLYSESAGSAGYLGSGKPIYEVIRERELPYEWLGKLASHCDKRGIIFLCSPFDEASADELEGIGISAYKVASYSIDNISFLRHVARKKRPVLLSTGASEINEIKRAVEIIKKEGNSKIAVLQCTAKYPAPLSSVNLRVIPRLKAIFDTPIGLSDHSRDPLIAPLGAVALGANIIEKHYTTDNSLPGPDHTFAVLPEELRDMVRGIRGMEAALGSAEKKVTPEERELQQFAKNFLYAKVGIRDRGVLSEGNVIALRPGTGKRGVSASEIDRVLGKKARRDLVKGDAIGKNDYE